MKGINHFAVVAREQPQVWFICSVTPQHLKRDVDEASARLIAASPRLLEALQGVLKLIEDNDLVRDISRDANLTYFMQQGCRITNALKAAQDSLTLATPKKGE